MTLEFTNAYIADLVCQAQQLSYRLHDIVFDKLYEDTLTDSIIYNSKTAVQVGEEHTELGKKLSAIVGTLREQVVDKLSLIVDKANYTESEKGDSPCTKQSQLS